MGGIVENGFRIVRIRRKHFAGDPAVVSDAAESLHHGGVIDVSGQQIDKSVQSAGSAPIAYAGLMDA